MKTNSSFRLSKQSKRLLALLPSNNAETRYAYKHMLIDAQIASTIKVKAKNKPDGQEE